MIFKMGEIVAIIGVFKKILSIDFNIKTSLKIIEIYNKILPYQIEYEKKCNAIIEKYGQKNEQNEFVFNEQGLVPLTNQSECKKILKELNDREYDIEIELISIDELSEIKISPLEAYKISKIIK